MNIYPEFLGEDSGQLAGTTYPRSARAAATERVIEMVGVSDIGWSEAARQIVARASERPGRIERLDVLRNSVVVRDGAILEFHVIARVAFAADAGEPCSL